MTKTQNVKRKFRRKEKDKENAAKGKDQKELKLDQKEQFIYKEAKLAIATAKTNQQNIVAINEVLDELSKMINTYDQKMAMYDKDEIRPRFEASEKKNDLLIDLLLRSNEELELSDDEIKILELEEFDEEPAKNNDADTLGDNGVPGKPIKPKKKATKKVKIKNE